MSAAADQVTVAHLRLSGFGSTVEVPFAVGEGVDRIAVEAVARGHASFGIGLFDPRGAAYQSPGFRGVYGSERHDFWVSARGASEGFLPGPIPAGRWTLVFPVFRSLAATDVDVTVRLRHGPAVAPLAPAPVPELVRDIPGWYRGDLHVHSTASSDAASTGTALAPEAWADECRRAGLDFVALTDHNVVAQNRALAGADGTGVLLLGGEEMTNWSHGHATVAGMATDDWLDWRQRPRGLRLGRHEARITDLLRTAEEMGAYVAAAHPLQLLVTWQFFAEARTHGIEVWNGHFSPTDAAAVARWDSLLRRGQRIAGSGGSDLHGRDNLAGISAGMPTTVVHAEALSRRAVLAALRAGRSYLTRRPGGPGVVVWAQGADGVRRIMGETVRAHRGTPVPVGATVRGGRGLRLLLIADGRVRLRRRLHADDETVTTTVRSGEVRYLRAELHGRASFDPRRPLAGRLDMEALTNPVYLAEGRPGDEAAAGEAWWDVRRVQVPL